LINPNSNFFLIENKLKLLEDIKSTSRYWNITWNQGEYLSSLILENKPNLVLEFGTSNGFSTLWLAKNLDSTSKIYTIEVDDSRFKDAKKNFSDCKLNNINQIKGEISEILNSNQLDNLKFDFVLLDAGQKIYKEIIEKLIEKNLIDTNTKILCDNVLSHTYMGPFIEFMKERFLNNEIIELGGGFLFSFTLK
jgi:predicted O-methyltransferase YrrM